MAGRSRGWAVCAAALLVLAGCGRAGPVDGPDPATAFQGSLAGVEAVARAFPAVDDRPLHWPADHAIHPRHFTESWHLAGLLRDGEGRRYGFQLLLQRVALQADGAPRDSAWAAAGVWQGVFSIEPERAARVAAERFSREALGLAGGSAGEEAAAAWLEDWRIELAPEAGTGRLLGATDEAVLELSLRLPALAPAATAAEARRGYWWPGLEAAGTLSLAGRTFAVRGSALLERSWGQLPPLGRGQLALARLWTQQGGAAVRCEQLRRRGGGGVPLGECTEFPSGRVLAEAAEPVGVAGGASIENPPLEWALRGPGAETTTRWAPLAEPGVAGAAWSGIIVPVDAGAAADSWGLLALSNFTAP